ncbi:acetyltransferase [Anaerobacillus sp. CMMVII]|nr:acetyltransferase [Anaerobacillus sp. CMMVII]MCT8139012.1 acetyltransferase [Anaerobacillus sp. CMMVII]
MITANNQHEIVGYLDDKYQETTIINHMYVGPISSLKELIYIFKEVSFVIGIGNNRIRKNIVTQLNLPKQSYATLIHPSAVISPRAKIGSGTVIMANAVVNVDANIGQHSIINTGAIVEHDNRLGNFVHISPNATLTGTAHIEDGVHVGAGATVIPNITVGEWSVIGGGATVINHIPPYCTAVGVPAKVISKERVEFV